MTDAIHSAVGGAASTITTLPANFTRFPNSDRRVFDAVCSKPTRRRDGERLAQARPRVLDWWQTAWRNTLALRERFGTQVRCALPVADPTDLAEVYAALAWRRLRLRQDQQAPELPLGRS